jgi:hypothetical protein
MPLEECAERARLSRIVAGAIAEVYRARAAYDAAKQKGAENLNALGLVLLEARGAERAAEDAFRDHVTTHGCQG